MSDQYGAPQFYGVRQAVLRELRAEHPEMSREEVERLVMPTMRALLVSWLAEIDKADTPAIP